VAVRLRLCPFGAIDDLLPTEGRIVDIACGHGHLALLLASGAPNRHVLGVDIDERKIAAADGARDRVGFGPDRVEYAVSAPGFLPDGPVDAVTIVDALYLFTPAARERLVRASARALAPGGMLLVKEMDMSSRALSYRAKAFVAHSGELVMTRLAGITASSTDEPSFTAPSDLEAWMRAEGLRTTVERWDRRYPVPHLAVYGRR